ncbi:hypothetical protein AB0H00_02320 [Nocardia sp. NPDC023852]|uniref:hypothetical protein n=1 Tax=Nocardia sp. NPDC023852 TaxID=3154697 RepID=UPI0033DAD156
MSIVVNGLHRSRRMAISRADPWSGDPRQDADLVDQPRRDREPSYLMVGRVIATVVARY